MESDSDIRPIESLEQIPSTLRPELYALLLKANQAHGPERTEVAVDEINLFSRLVFEDQNRWDSSMLPSTPVHRPMEPGNDGVIGPIGRFIEVLPEPFNVQPKSGFLTIVVRRIYPFWITSLSVEHSPTRHARSTARLSSRSNSTPPLVFSTISSSMITSTPFKLIWLNAKPELAFLLRSRWHLPFVLWITMWSVSTITSTRT